MLLRMGVFMGNAIVLRALLSSTTPHSTRLIPYATAASPPVNLTAPFPPRQGNGPSWRGLGRLVALGTILFSAEIAPGVSYAQELPLERCDVLPMIEVRIAGLHKWFLVDTAATSMLNLESFTAGRARDIHVTSWSGTLATSAKEVTLPDLSVGRTKLLEVKLPAIDLSAIGKTCGRKIDGILGVDLLGKLGASINLKEQTIHVATPDEVHGAELVTAMQHEMHRCVDAFNDSDEQRFADCLDPKIVLFSMDTQLYGREQVVGYFRQRYFHQEPAAKLEIRESAFHPIGEAVWYEYEFTIESSGGRLHGRGMAMCKRSDGHWRMASMHHSIAELESAGLPREKHSKE
jgi:ketosteroid isomerase-like protein